MQIQNLVCLLCRPLNRVHDTVISKIPYRGLISATNSATVESVPKGSEAPGGISDLAALFVTPLGHLLVIMNQGNHKHSPETKKYTSFSL